MLLEHSAILLTCIKQLFGLENQFFGLFESGCFTQVLLYELSSLNVGTYCIDK